MYEDDVQCKIRNFELEIHRYLKLIQKYDSSFINHLVNMQEYYGVLRYFRRGSNISAHNKGSQHLIVKETTDGGSCR